MEGGGQEGGGRVGAAVQENGREVGGGRRERERGPSKWLYASSRSRWRPISRSCRPASTAKGRALSSPGSGLLQPPGIGQRHLSALPEAPCDAPNQLAAICIHCVSTIVPPPPPSQPPPPYLIAQLIIIIFGLIIVRFCVCFGCTLESIHKYLTWSNRALGGLDERHSVRWVILFISLIYFRSVSQSFCCCRCFCYIWAGPPPLPSPLSPPKKTMYCQALVQVRVQAPVPTDPQVE